MGVISEDKTTKRNILYHVLFVNVWFTLQQIPLRWGLLLQVSYMPNFGKFDSKNYKGDTAGIDRASINWSSSACSENGVQSLFLVVTVAKEESEVGNL